MTVAGADLPTPFAVAVVSLLVGVAAAGCANTVPTAPDSANDGLSSGMSAPFHPTRRIFGLLPVGGTTEHQLRSGQRHVQHHHR